MKKIAYIVSDIDKAVYFEDTALALREAGFQVHFILINSKNGALEKFLAKHNFQIYSIEAGPLTRSFKQIGQVKGYLKTQKIELVHCHLAHANWIGLWAAKWAGVKTRIYTRHSGEPLRINRKEKLIDKIQNRLATKIVAITQMIDELLLQQGVPKHKRIVIHHGFHLERFTLTNSEATNELKKLYNPENAFPIVGVNSRWLELKGIQYIIPAFKELLMAYPNAKLILFGGSPSGDYYNQIRELLDTIPTQNQLSITFEENVYGLYQVFDLYVHVPVNPTCEAFGQTYVEALAAGIPSVFTLSGIAHEFIRDKKNALVVPYQDYKSIHHALTSLLENESLRTVLIETGKKDVVELFSFNTYIASLINLYNE